MAKLDRRGLDNLIKKLDQVGKLKGETITAPASKRNDREFLKKAAADHLRERMRRILWGR